MNGSRAEARMWAEAAVAAAEDGPNDAAVFPPYPWLTEVGAVVGGTRVALGGQACHGEISFGSDGDSFCSNPACHGRTWPRLDLDAKRVSAPTTDESS